MKLIHSYFINIFIFVYSLDCFNLDVKVGVRAKSKIFNFINYVAIVL